MAAERARLPWLVSTAPHAVALGPDGLPVVTAVTGAERQVQLPEDVEGVRRADPQAGRAWRLAVREGVLAGLAQGQSVTGMTADGALVMEVSP